MVYERAHTRELAQLQPMNLSAALPFAAGTFVLGAAAAMGLPGFSGFIAELQVLVGAWKAFPALMLLAGFGALVGVAYMLRVIIKGFFAETRSGRAGDADSRRLHFVAGTGGGVDFAGRDVGCWPLAAGVVGRNQSGAQWAAV